MANSAFNHSPSITVPTGASTNDAVVRWDGTGGLTLQNSVLIVSDAGVISGATQISIDNIRIYDNSIISTNSNGSISITPDGTGSVAISKADINGGTIDGTAIGVSTASTIAGTTITAATSVTTPILLLSGSSNSLTLDVGNSVAAYTVILPDAAPTANDKILKTSGGSPYSQLVWGDAAGGGPSAASEAEMVTASSTTVYASPGRVVYNPHVLKAGGRSNDSGVLQTGSVGFDSITRYSGTIYYKWYMEPDFDNTNYFGMASNTSGNPTNRDKWCCGPSSLATGNCNVETWDDSAGAYADAEMCLLLWGTLE